LSEEPPPSKRIRVNPVRIALSGRSLAFFCLGVLAIIAFFYAFADVQEALSIISSADLLVYALSFVSVTLGTLACTLAWHVLLCNAGMRISLLREWKIIWVSVFVNIIIPTGSVSGEVTRIYLTLQSLADRDTKKSVGEVTSTVLAHRVMTLVPFLLGSVAGFIYLSDAYKNSTVIVVLASLLVVIFSAAFLGVCYLCASPSTAEKVAKGLIELLHRLPVKSLRTRLDKASISIDENIGAFNRQIQTLFRDPRSLALASFFSVLFWVFDIFVAYFVFLSIGFPISFVALIFVYTIGTTIQMIPIGVPGMIGVVEVTMIALYTATGIPPAVGAAGTLLIRIVMLWFEALVGGFTTYLVVLREK